MSTTTMKEREMTTKQYETVCKDKFVNIEGKLDNVATKHDQAEIKEKVNKLFTLMYEGNGIPALSQVARDFKKLQGEHDSCQETVKRAKEFLEEVKLNRRSARYGIQGALIDIAKVTIVGLVAFYAAHHGSKIIETSSPNTVPIHAPK